MKSQEKTTQKQKKSSQKGHILCENDKKEGWKVTRIINPLSGFTKLGPLH
jgi:hypothetical protein